MNYTPAPWEVKHQWNVMSGSRLVAGCGGHSSNIDPHVDETNKANARLVAAAPLLLDALQELQKQVHVHHKMSTQDDFSLMIADSAASKAIKAATS